MNFTEWLTQLIGEDSQRAASAKSGMAESTLSRQLSRGSLRPEMVIALCRGYGRSPVTGLIETGYLQEWEAEGVSIPYALRNASNRQLLDEIMKRSDPEANYLFGDPLGESIDYQQKDAEVFELPTPTPPPSVKPLSDDELAAAIEEANQLRGAAQNRTEELIEPEAP